MIDGDGQFATLEVQMVLERVQKDQCCRWTNRIW